MTRETIRQLDVLPGSSNGTVALDSPAPDMSQPPSSVNGDLLDAQERLFDPQVIAVKLPPSQAEPGELPARKPRGRRRNRAHQNQNQTAENKSTTDFCSYETATDGRSLAIGGNVPAQGISHSVSDELRTLRQSPEEDEEFKAHLPVSTRGDDALASTKNSFASETVDAVEQETFESSLTPPSPTHTHAPPNADTTSVLHSVAEKGSSQSSAPTSYADVLKAARPLPHNPVPSRDASQDSFDEWLPRKTKSTLAVPFHCSNRASSLPFTQMQPSG